MREAGNTSPSRTCVGVKRRAAVCTALVRLTSGIIIATWELSCSRPSTGQPRAISGSTEQGWRATEASEQRQKAR